MSDLGLLTLQKLTRTPILAQWQYSNILPINGAFVGTAIYSAYYLALHKGFGTMIAPLLFASLYHANKFATMTDLPMGLGPMAIATIIHFTSWVFQISNYSSI